jgi:hypothetical protein
VRTLDRLADHARVVQGIRVETVTAGDWIVVRTANSVYSLAALGEGNYRVSGGWFTARGADSSVVRIAGCTWGGPALHTRLIAAPGMHLEFTNGVRTTRIRDVRLGRGASGPHSPGMTAFRT